MSLSFQALFRRKNNPSDARARAERLIAEGLAAEHSGNPAQALAHFEAAIEADAACPDAHINRGIALHTKGHLDDAAACHERALALDPHSVAAHCNLALVHLARADFSLAEASFRAALHCRSGEVEAWIGLAAALEGAGRDEEALAALGTAVALRPNHTGALGNEVALLRKLGRLERAVTIDRRILELEPENAAIHYRLGLTLNEQGLLVEAEAAFRRTLALAPSHMEAAANLGKALIQQGRPLDAIPWLFKAVDAFPGNAWLKRTLVESLNSVELGAWGSLELRVLRKLCLDDDVSTLFLLPAVAGIIRRHPGFIRLRVACERGYPFPVADPSVQDLLRDPLLLAALPRTVMADPPVEVVLTYLRRSILLDGAYTLPPEFVCGLARQCFFSAYAFLAGEDEQDEVARLRALIEREIGDVDADTVSLEMRIATFALYDSLRTLSGCERLLDTSRSRWSLAFAPLVEEQIADHLRERELRARITLVKPIKNQVSMLVRAMYEENPYPRWTTSPSPGPEPFEKLWERLHGRSPDFACSHPASVLVAGCGTGRHPIQAARRDPEASVLAVDLSIASLAYAARMTAKLDIHNIEYRQGDILELGALGRRFMVIESCGVLHHLSDPMEGWRVLRNLLEPFGLMQIALYSEKARACVRSAREFVKASRFSATTDGLCASRHAIMGLPPEHLAKGVMTWVDFYTLDEFRDLVMHVQEHTFTLPQIARCLDKLDLRLLRLESTPRVHSRFVEMFPDRDAGTDLEAWDRFEDANPDTFKAMYTFWCCPR